jgi:chromosome segregation ATPase
MKSVTSYADRKEILEYGISSMPMEKIKPLLCGKSRGDAYVCIDCATTCPFGRRAIELLEKETKGETPPMNRKQICAASKKVEAMENYLDAMTQQNPVEYVKEKYNIEQDRVAKNKIYQWQHNYGTNLGSVSNEIKEIKLEIAASQQRVDKLSPEVKSAEIESKIAEIPGENVKPTKKQEKEISKNHLSQMRTDLENEYLELEKEIGEHKKAIEKCEARIQEIVEQTNALRAVLDMFKPKDGRPA